MEKMYVVSGSFLKKLNWPVLLVVSVLTFALANAAIGQSVITVPSMKDNVVTMNAGGMLNITIPNTVFNQQYRIQRTYPSDRSFLTVTSTGSNLEIPAIQVNSIGTQIITILGTGENHFAYSFKVEALPNSTTPAKSKMTSLFMNPGGNPTPDAPLAEVVSTIPILEYAIPFDKTTICTGGAVYVAVGGVVSGHTYRLQRTFPTSGPFEDISATTDPLSFSPVNPTSAFTLWTVTDQTLAGFAYTFEADVVATPIAPTLTISQAEGNVCAGPEISATAMSGGTGGYHCNNYTYYSIDGGTLWIPYTLGTPISSTQFKIPSIKIMAVRKDLEDRSCSAATIYTWPILSYVHDVTGPNKGSYCKIQQAIDASFTATGDVLEVDYRAAAYDEQLLVNKEVTIKGVGAFQPTVDFITGSATGKPTLLDISANNVTIDNIHFNVDLAKLRSAIIASASGIDNISVTNNTIDCYGTAAGSYGDRNAVSINYATYRVATGGVNNITFTGNTINGTTSSFFRSGVSVDEGGGTFSGNTLKTGSHDILVRFGSNGAVGVTGNNLNGGGIELADQNAAAGTFTISGNIFTGGFSDPTVALLRIKNNYNSIPHIVSMNTFNYVDWAVSLENMNTVTLDGNTFLSSVVTAHAVVINTKSITGNSSAIVQVPLGAAITNNNFNGTGTALTFLNHDSDNDSYGTFSIGTVGNENKFASTLGTFILFDPQTGSSDAATFPNYAVIIGTGGTKTTTMACWDQNINIQNNKFDVGSGLQLPSAMNYTQRTALENGLFHKPDNSCLGQLIYFIPVWNFTQNTYHMTIQAAVNLANPNDKIICSEWLYNEKVTIDKSLWLTGENEANCVIDGTGLGVGSGIYINNGVTGVKIEKFTINNHTGAGPNSYAGIYAVGGNDNLIVQHCTIKNNVGGSGVYANGPITTVLFDDLDISGHTNVSGAARGIVIWNGLKSNITVTNCEVYNNNCCGIELQDGTATGVTMTGNNVHDNADNGFGLNGLKGPGVNLIKTNTVTNNGRFGIEVKNPNGTGATSGPGSIVVEDNTVTFTASASMNNRDHAGISVYRRGFQSGNPDGYPNIPTGVVIQNNPLIDGYKQLNPGSSDEGFGIVIEGTNNTVTGNTINNCNIGIQQQGGGHPNPNYVPDNAGDGATDNGLSANYFGRGNAPVACGNAISGNTFSGNTTNTRNSGPYGGAGYVLNTNTGETFCSIQAAIDDAQTVNTNTISVSAGIYKEQVTVNKGLTIVGDVATPDNVIIDGENKTTLVNGGQVRIFNPTGAVDFKGFKIINTGSQPSSDHFGILTKGSYSITVQNCKLIGHGSSVDIGSDYGFWAYGASGALVIKNNYFNNMYHAILLERQWGASTIQGNTFDALYTGLYSGSQYGGRAIEAINYGTSDVTTLQRVTGNSFVNFKSTGIIFSGGFGTEIPKKFTNVEIDNNDFKFIVTDIVNSYGAINLRNVSTGNSDPAGGVTANIHNNNIDVPTVNSIIVTGLNGNILYNNNSIKDNGQKGLDASGALGTPINATCNWWGSDVYATILSKISGTATFMPYLVGDTEQPGEATTVGFQPLTPNTCALGTVAIASATPDNIICGETSGSISVVFSGGTSPFDISWTGPTPGSATGISSPYAISGLSGLAAGLYNITVYAVGSQASTSATVQSLPVHLSSPLSDFSTISPAITAADPGATITVCSGTYPEHLIINTTGLIVKNAPSATPIIEGGGTGTIVQITADNVTFDGFALQHSGRTVNDAGILLGTVTGIGTGTGVTGCTVQNNTLTTDVNGIVLAFGSANMIKSNILELTGEYGILLGASTGNTIELNDIKHNFQEGIFLDNQSAFGGSDYSLGSTGNHIKTNTVTNVVGPETAGGEAINLGENCDGNFVTDANVIDGGTYGIHIWKGDNNLVDGNTINNITTLRSPGYSAVAIRFWNAQTNTITNNNITGNMKAFELAALSAGNQIHNNNISGNGSCIDASEDGGIIVNATCNWYGTADYATINPVISGNVTFVPYLQTSDLSGPGYSCAGGPSLPFDLTVTQDMASQNIQVQFEVTQGDLDLKPIPGLNPAIPADLAQIAALYQALATALAGTDPDAIRAAAMAIGDDAITEYYYMDGGNKVYLKTASNNDLIKQKYWQEYLVQDAPGNPRFPNWLTNLTLVAKNYYYRTSTNPATGAVANGWLNNVLGRNLYVKVTLIQNGNVNSISKSVAIPAGCIVNTNTGFGYPTIQAAITAASTNDVIEVCAGTFTEIGQILITKNLTINGAGKTATTIKPDANQTDWFQVNSGVTFHLSKVKLDGTGRVITHAINYQGNGAVNDCWFTEIKGASKYAYGTGVQVKNPANVNITNCDFDQMGRTGIRHEGTGTVSSNKYTGKGTGDWLDYFILAEYGCDITIDANNVSNCIGVATLDGSTSSAIAVWDDPGTKAIITNNILTNNSAGIGFEGINSTDPAYPWPQATIGGGNIITGGDYGLLFGAWDGSKFKPTLTFGATTLKGQSNQAIYMGDNIGIGTKYDVSSVIIKDGADNVITNNFAKEDLIYHAIDGLNRGLLMWVPSNVYVTDMAASTATNNDYTRIRNAVGLVSSNWTINLHGTFDWTETNAAASWALGNDGISGNDDDYTVLVPAGLTGVTFTAPEGLGSATIQGPGDLPGANLEGTLNFWLGNNQNWTISNLNIFDFDLALGMFNVGTNDYNNTLITNNHFRIPKDLNISVAPLDVNQNIGIHYSFGTNQTISNNIFDVAGDGVSDGTNYSASIVMQSNTSGGTLYDGLKIKDNTITVTGVPSAYPAVIRGIWENGSNSDAVIEISGNVFSNANPANTADLNRQVAFWVTSVSGLIKKVEYKNNEVSGFNEGVAWIGGAYTPYGPPLFQTGQFPVKIINNKFDGMKNAVVVRKAVASTNTGSPAQINDNSFTNFVSGGLAIKNEGTGDAASTCNWYGTSDGDLIPALINGTVTYSPWLTDGSDGSGVGFQPTGTCNGSPVEIVSTVPDNIICGETTGSILVTYSGGAAPYDITWTGGGFFNDNPGLSYNITGLAAGNYFITVTDNNGTSFTTPIAVPVLYLPVKNTAGPTYYATIQEAITAASDNNIIEVCAGTYPEQLIINKQLDIRGPNFGTDGNSSRDAEAIIVPPSELNLTGQREWSATPLISLAANGIKMNGFKISGDNPLINGYSYAGMNLEAGLGILSTGNNIEFLNNIVEKFTYMGFYSSGNQVSPHYKDLVIEHNKFENIHDMNQLGYGFAIYMQGSTGSVSYNTVTNSRTAIQIQPYDVQQSGTIAPVVYDNDFSVWRNGIYYNYAENDASAWTISLNTITACTPPVNPTGRVGWQGITAETMRGSSNGGTISSNIINGTGAATDINKWWGVWGLLYKGTSSTSTEVNFTGNTVSNVEIGLVHSASADIVLTGNSLNASVQSISIQHNYSSGGADQGNGGTNNIDAIGGNTINGIASAGASLAQLFDIEDAITHKIDESYRGMVTVTANQLYVTPLSYAGLNTTADIQRAINAAGATGWTINIEGGAYSGTADASGKSITLSPGASPACVAIPGVLTLSGDDNLSIDLNGTTVCSEFDQLTIGGAVTLGNSNLALSLGSFVPSSGDEFTIIDGSSPVVGKFLQGSTITVGGYTFSINYTGGDGNDVVLTSCGTGVVHNVTPGHTGNFCKIQDAINAAYPGDEIHVDAGIYDEQVVIDSKNLTLQGAGDATIIRPSGPSILTSTYTHPTGIFWPGSVMSGILLVKNSPAVIVKNLKVDGINITSLPTTTPANDRLSGVLYGESSGTIDNVTVNNIKTTGYADRTYGIELSGAGTGTHSVEVKDCDITDWARNGIVANGASLTANIHDNFLVGPGSILGQVPNGIVFISGAVGNVTSNTIHGSHYTGTASRSAGIMFWGPFSTSIVAEKNNIYDVDDGVQLTSNANLVYVQKNNLHNNLEVGVHIEDGATNNQIINNYITSNAIAGIRFAGALETPPENADDPPGTGNVAHDNSITGNAIGIVNYDNTLGPFNATCNWYDGGINSVSGDITWIPLLPTGDDVGDYTPGFHPSATCATPTEFYVDDNSNTGDIYTPGVTGNDANTGTAASPFRTIQHAIDLAGPGTKIWVDAGNYPESLGIGTDNLSLVGPNTGKVPNIDPRNPEAFIKPAEWYGVYVEAQGVTIDGFTIDGLGTCDYTIYAGTTSGQGGLLVTNNIVKNAATFGFLGYVPSGPSSSNNLVIKNMFLGIGDRAVVSLWNYYADVTDNVILAVPVGIYAENANLPEASGTVEWKKNNISASRAGIWYNLAYGTATPLTISDNTINYEEDATMIRWDGIWLTSLGGSVNPIISGNEITGADPSKIVSGYNLWNNTTTAADGIIIQGGFVHDADYGVWINNWDGYPTSGSNAGHTKAKLNQVNITDADLAGVYIKDNPLNTGGASAYVYAKIQNSTISGSGEGILVQGNDASADVINNLTTITGNVIGIEITNNASAAIVNNTINANTVGISIHDGGNLTSCTGNAITANPNGGIMIASSAGTISAITENTISGNGNMTPPNHGIGLQNDLPTTTVDASPNWWGFASGPYNNPYNTCGEGNAVIGKVAFDPWWTAPAGGLSPTQLVQNTDKGTYYCKIQDAINDATPGDHIVVAAGNFEEQLLIQKDIFLTGAGIGSTIVKVPASGRLTAPGYTSQVWTADNWNTDYLLAAYPVDPVSGSPVSVKVTGFTFDANGQSHIGDRFTGVYFRKVKNATAGNAGLFDCEIKGFSTSDPSVTGIRVMENSKLTLHHNTVKDYTILGIVVYGTDNLVDPYVVTDNNTLVPYSTAQGIQYRFINGSPVSGEILSNTIDGSSIPIAASYCDHVKIDPNIISNSPDVGILLEASNYCTVADNVITNFVMNGIEVNGNNNTISGNNISDNTGFCYAGISIYDGTGNNVIKNVISNIHSADISTIDAAAWAIATWDYYGTASGNSIGDGTCANANIITNSDASIVFYGAGSGNTAKGNKIAGNTPYSLNNVGGAVVDASLNWWGSSTGPTVASNPGGSGDPITNAANVTYEPWYNTVNCDEPVYQLDAFTVSGTATVCPGTNTDVTLSGSQAGTNYEYRLYRNTILVPGSMQTGTGGILTWSVSEPACNSSYTYTVIAKNTLNDLTLEMTSSAIVTFRDIAGPSITGTIPESTVEGCTASNAPAPVTTVAELELLGIFISDACTPDASLVVTSSDSPSGTCPIKVTRTYTVKDACLNESTYDQIINVDDQTAPSITGTIDESTVDGCVAGDVPAPVTTVLALEALGLNISDACTPDASLAVTSSDASSGSCPIKVTRTYTVKDACLNSNTYHQIIWVKDQTAPVLSGTNTWPPDVTLISACSSDYPEGKTEAEIAALYEDNCSGIVNVTKTTTGMTGTDCNWSITYNYRIEDVCLNGFDNTISYSGSDKTPPDITNEGGNKVIGIGASCIAYMPDFTSVVTATDNCGTAVTDITQLPAVGTEVPSGITNITITVKDVCGNPSYIHKTLTVYDGPITYAPILTVCEGSNFDMPITVTSFNDVSAISLTFKYDGDVIEYRNLWDNNSGLIAYVTKSGSGPNSFIKIDGAPSPASYLGSGTLLTLKFKLKTSGSSDLTWIDTPDENCEYGFKPPDGGWEDLYFCDDPYIKYYKVGKITGKATPTVEAGPDQTVCENAATVTMTGYSYGGGATGGEWSGGHGSWSGNVYTPALADLYSIVLTYTTTGAYPCSNISDTKTLFFDKVPTSAAAGIDQDLCNTWVATLAGNNPTIGTGLWTVVSQPAGSNVTFLDATVYNTTATVDAYGAYTYKWTISNGTCSPSSDEVTVTYYKQVTTANAGAEQSICAALVANTEANIAVVGIGTWTKFSGPGTVVFGDVNDPTTTATASAYGTYVLRWTIVNGTCSSYADVTINYYEQVTTANAGAEQSICAALVANTNANTAVVGIGTWTKFSGPGTVIFGDVNDPTTTATASAYGTYVLRWTIVNGTCSSYADVTINYYEQVTTANAGAEQSICAALVANTEANIAVVGIGTWTKFSGPGTVIFGDVNDPTTTATASVYGTYVLRWTIVNGTCSSYADVTINYYEQVTTANAGAEQSICAALVANTEANTAVVGIGTWTKFSGPGTVVFGDVNDPTTTATASAYGTYVLRWTIVNGTCSSYADVTINYYEQVTTANAGAEQSICAALAANTNANTAVVGIGTWTKFSGPGTVIFGDVNDPTTTATASAYGTYVLRWTIVNGTCSSYADVTINYYEQVTTANAGAEQSICAALVANTNANTAVVGIGTWTKFSGPGTVIFGDVNDPTTTATASVYGSYVLRWTIVNGTCSSYADVTINYYEQVTTANAGAEQSICAALVANTNANTAVVGIGTWTKFSGPGTVVFGDVNDPTTTATASAYGTYVLRWTIVNGTCSSYADVTINYYEQVTTANAGAEQSICAALVANTEANIAVEGIGTWTKFSGPGTVIFGDVNDPTTTATASAYGTYVLRWTIVNGTCSSYADVTINYYEQVTTANAGAEQSICAALVANTEANIAVVGIGTWTKFSGPGTVVFGDVNDPTTTATASAYGTYVLRWTIVNGTCSSYADVTINYYEQVTTANAGAEQSICAALVDNTEANIAVVGIGTWTKFSGPGTVIFGDVNDPTTTATASAYGTYVLRWTIVNGTCSSYADVTINYYEQVTTANAGAEQSICAALVANTEANISVVGIGTWTKFSGPGTVVFGDVNDPTTTATASAYGTYVLRWTIVNGTCSSYADVTINYYEQVTTANAGAEQSICAALVANTNANTAVVGIGTWTKFSGPGTVVFGDVNDPTTTATASAYGTYVLRWTIVNGTCSSYADVTINYYEQVTTANAGPDQSVICGYVTNLAGNNPTVGTGKWTVETKPSGATVIFGSDAVYNTTATVDTYGAYTFKWTITNGACSSSDNVDVSYYSKATVSGTVKYNNSGGDINMTGLNVRMRTGLGTPLSPYIYYGTTGITNGLGFYTISDVCPGTYDVEITGFPTSGGVNATDAAQVNSWYVTYVTPFPTKPTIQKTRFYAGDVDDVLYFILPQDASRILQYFVNSGIPSWSNRGLWTYWQVGTTNTNPTPGTLIPTVTIDPGVTSLPQNFYALCTGDFNLNYTPYAKAGNANLELDYAQTRQVDVNSEVELPLYAGSGMDVTAASLILNFPSDKVEITDVYLGSDPDKQLMYAVSGDELRIGWQSLDAVSLKTGEKLLTMKLRFIGELGKGEEIRFTLANNDLNELAGATYNVISGAVLFVDVLDAAIGVDELNSSDKLTFGNYPNPFNDKTTFAYTLPFDGKVTLDLYNMLGSKVKTLVNEEQSAGDHRFTMDSRIVEPAVYTAVLKLDGKGTVLTGVIKILRTH